MTFNADTIPGRIVAVSVAVLEKSVWHFRPLSPAIDGEATARRGGLAIDVAGFDQRLEYAQHAVAYPLARASWNRWPSR